MKTKLIATAALAIASLSTVSAMAMNSQYGEAALAIGAVTSASSITRSEVEADYLQARKSGALPAHAEASSALATGASTTTSRADVRAKAVQSVMKDGRNGAL